MKCIRWFPALALAGTVPAAFGTTIPVSSGGSISAALASAAAGDSVLVEAGTYSEHVVLKDGVALRGGYDSSFSEGTRDPAANLTTITGSGSGPAITSSPSVGPTTVVDGFLLTGGGGTPGTGVLVVGGAPVFSGNEIGGNHLAGIAGGAYVHSGSAARFVNNVIADNSSLGSGGGMRIEGSTVQLIGNIFDNNVAPHSGGGLYVFASAVVCSSNTFSNNDAGQGGGGGLYLQAASGGTFVGNDFSDNSAPYGGGIFIRDETVATIRDSDFVACHATLAGGGVAALLYSTANLVDCRFDGCTSVGSGGGIWANRCTVNFSGTDATAASPTSFLRDCTATGAGGGISVGETTGTIEFVRFTDCRSDSMGGGLYALHSALTVRRNVIESCVAVDGGGMALHTTVSASNRESNVVNNTIWGCRGTRATANPAGGVQLFSISSLRVATLRGNIIANILEGACLRCGAGGVAGVPGFGCLTIHKDPANPTPEIPGSATNGCVTAFSSSTTNRIEDPKFCSAPVDYRLQACSPAVDNNNCVGTESKENRGAAPDNTECPCGVFSLEPASWGKIKALYR